MFGTSITLESPVGVMSLFGESDLEEEHLEFVMSRGGLHWIYPTSQSAMAESDLKLFKKHGCRWIVPRGRGLRGTTFLKEIPSFRNLLVTFHSKDKNQTAWNIIFRKKKYLVAGKTTYDKLNCQNTRHLPLENGGATNNECS